MKPHGHLQFKTMGPKRRKTFETELSPASIVVAFLYHVNGKRAEPISVSKEVFKGYVSEPYLRFFVWTALDTVNPEYTTSGQLKHYGRSHPTFEAALKVAMKIKEDAIASGRWVIQNG